MIICRAHSWSRQIYNGLDTMYAGPQDKWNTAFLSSNKNETITLYWYHNMCEVSSGFPGIVVTNECDQCWEQLWKFILIGRNNTVTTGASGNCGHFRWSIYVLLRSSGYAQLFLIPSSITQLIYYTQTWNHDWGVKNYERQSFILLLCVLPDV